MHKFLISYHFPGSFFECQWESVESNNKPDADLPDRDKFTKLDNPDTAPCLVTAVICTVATYKKCLKYWMHQNIMRTNLILINFEFMVCVELMNTEYQQDKFFWKLVDVMLWISGVLSLWWNDISIISYQVAGQIRRDWILSWRLRFKYYFWDSQFTRWKTFSVYSDSHRRTARQVNLQISLYLGLGIMIDYVLSHKRHSPIHSIDKYC